MKESEEASGIWGTSTRSMPEGFRILIRLCSRVGSLYSLLLWVFRKHKNTQQIGSTNWCRSDSDRYRLSFRLFRCCVLCVCVFVYVLVPACEAVLHEMWFFCCIGSPSSS